MTSNPIFSRSPWLSAIVGLTACAALSACAPTAIRSSAQSTAPTPSQVIAQLQEAKNLDRAGYEDPTVGVVRKGDFLEHEASADHVIGDLEHGRSIPQGDLNYALEVPPRHIQPAQRAALIRQLKDAIHEDEQREQSVVAFSSYVFYEDPDAPSQFGSQAQLAQREMENLAAGNHVSWDEVQRALYVPPNPL